MDNKLRIAKSRGVTIKMLAQLVGIIAMWLPLASMEVKEAENKQLKRIEFLVVFALFCSIMINSVKA